MIKFFGQIRQNLIKENKTTNYIKYAIGEIVLVVIGILIALQINNWNENRKFKNQEIQYIKRLLTENKQDLITFSENIHALEKSLYSKVLGIAGTVDCIAEYNGELAVIDFKTSAKPKPKE